MRFLLALLCALCLAAPSRADEARDKPLIEAAANFYGAYVALGPRGLPDDAMREKLAPFITWSLAEQLKEALLVQKKFAASVKNEVPPMIDGDLFTSLYEGATKFEIRTCKRMAAGAECVVTLTYEGADGTRTKWNDFAILREEKSRWRLDDIRYAGEWNFANKGTLKQSLKAATAGFQ